VWRTTRGMVAHQGVCWQTRGCDGLLCGGSLRVYWLTRVVVAN
jgi:hypothetical protein